jgi:hypothetical protein
MNVGRLTIVLDVDSSDLDRVTRDVLPQLRNLGNAGDDVTVRISDGLQRSAGQASQLGDAGAGAAGKLQGIGVAVAATVVPFFIATGAALALVGAVGALGIAAAASTDEMKRVFGDTKDHIVSSIKEIAKPFRDTLLTINHHFRYAFDSVLPILGRLMTAVAPLVTVFGENLASGIANFVRALEPAVTHSMPTFLAVVKAINPLMTSLGKTFDNIVTPLGAFGHQTTAVFVNIGSLFEAVGKLIGVLAPLGAMILNALLPTVTQLVTTLANALYPIVVALEPVFATLGNLLGGLALALSPVIEAWGRLIATGLTVVAPLFDAVSAAVIALFQALSPLYVALLNIGATVLPMLTPLITALASAFNYIAEVINKYVAPAIAVFASDLTTGAVTAVNWLATTIKTAWDNSATETDTTWGRIKTTISTVLGQIWDKFVEIWDSKIYPYLVQKWGQIKVAAEDAWNNQIKPAILRAIQAIIDWLVAHAPEITRNLVRGFLEALPKIVAALAQIAWAIVTSFPNPLSMLYNIGKQIIQGLIKGIEGMLGTLKGVLGKVTGLIPSWKGPASVDARLLAPNGQLIIDGLIRGIESSLPMLKSALSGVTGSISANVGVPSVGPGGFGPGATAGAGATYVSLTFSGPVYADAQGQRRLANDLWPMIQQKARSSSRSNGGNNFLAA